MICNFCKTNSSHIKLFSDRTEICSNCADFPEVSGPRTDNILTRNSFRVRTQSVKYEGDTILPHAHDKNKHGLGINQEFIKLYPDRAKDYFTPEELAAANMPKLAKKGQADRQKEIKHKQDMIASVEHVGDPTKAIERVLTT